MLSNSKGRLAELRTRRTALKGKIDRRLATINRLHDEKWKAENELRWVEADIAEMTGKKP